MYQLSLPANFIDEIFEKSNKDQKVETMPATYITKEFTSWKEDEYIDSNNLKYYTYSYVLEFYKNNKLKKFSCHLSERSQQIYPCFATDFYLDQSVFLYNRQYIINPIVLFDSILSKDMIIYGAGSFDESMKIKQFIMDNKATHHIRPDIRPDILIEIFRKYSIFGISANIARYTRNKIKYQLIND